MDKTTISIIIKGILFPIILLAVTLLLAGRVDYIQGWIYNILNMVILIVTMIVLSNKRDLVEERLKPGEGMKFWDKLYFALSTPMYFIAIIIACLDSGRFGWTNDLPLAVYIIALTIYIAAQALFLWAKYVNKFLSSVVRIQTERGHEVCDKGPYRIIRHPSYIAGIVFGLCTPLILGSLWALIPQVIAAMMLVVRTGLEDKTLKNELHGYNEYAKRTKYRLVPFVW